MSHPKTVGDLRAALKDLPDNMPLIYSHDDEGNEFQKVIYEPSIITVIKSDSYRFLEIVEESDDISAETEECLCIN